MSLIDGILGQLGGTAIAQMSQNVGAQPNQVQGAISAALPMIISAMAKNSATPAGAQALNGALDQHDGGILGSLAGLIANPAGGQGLGILGHLLGGKQDNTANTLGQANGLSGAQMGTIMMTLAPIVMGYLGKMRNEQGLDENAVASVLSNEQQAHANANPGMMGMLSKLLDGNHDGSPVDDVLGMLGKLF